MRYDGLPSTAVNDILIRNNLFENNDTGALGIDAAFGIQIASNAMLDNYNQGLDCGGGVVAVGHCAKHIGIDNNFIWNRNVYAWPAILCAIAQAVHPNAVDKYTLAPALELWGTDISVTNNHFEYLTTSGIEATAVERLTITNNLIQNTSRGIQATDDLAPEEDDRPGVQIANCNAPVGQPSAYRPQVDFVTVTGNEIRNKGTIYQSYGVRLRHDPCGGSPAGMNAISIQAIPSGDNRQGDACRAPSVTQPTGSAQIGQCVGPVNLGMTLDGKYCGTSGCR